MTITNPDQIPHLPVYTITINANGIAAVNGEEITTPGLTVQQARVAALAEVRIKAAYHGRPVRALAKEADGTAWPLIVDTDGSVTALNHPHPTPAAAPPPPRPAPEEPQPPTPPAPAGDWTTDLPPALRATWAQLVAQEQSGSLTEALSTAEHLEAALAQHYGPQHVAPLHVLTLRAWLTLRLGESWAETTSLLIETVQRRQGAPVAADETERLTRNLHAAWRKLTEEDPDYAREIAADVMDLLDDDKRSRDVVRWLGAPA
ncbi:hypothetical protein ACFVZH_38085 [Streptomyces sp. NPDC059534]|uniref:hypothetical protein n=1 Tax=Streptomyces sp. NPDC059534 TaxID=3346859 RepID=UPI0036C8AFC2